MVRRLVPWLLAVALVAIGAPALAWGEHRVTGDEVRVTVEPTGKAVVEHRLGIRLNGAQRQKSFLLPRVDPDAAPLESAYVVPEADAHANSLGSALPLKLTVVDAAAGEDIEPGESGDRDLAIDVDADKGLVRGGYVFVFRYRTDLHGRGLIRREGALLVLEWRGPRLGVGLDNARVVFALPPAPTPPRAAAPMDDADASSFLSEVRRSSESDEIELVRTYAPEGARVTWAVRADPRAFSSLPATGDAPLAATGTPNAPSALVPVRWRGPIALALFLAFAALVFAKGRQVRRLATAARATMPALIPLPDAARAVLASAALVGGVVLQLLAEQPVFGALAVVVSVLLAAHGTARVDASVSLRGPGRWLAVSEREALVELPRPRGAPLDVSTRAGRSALALALLPFGLVAAWLAPRSAHHAALIALDAVAVLAVFATGRRHTLPADLAVEPSPFFRKLVATLRQRPGGETLRLVPRVRIPNGAVDADELRLLVVPRLPLRGFTSIEVAMTYALGFGARVAMPEILVRVVSGSPCDDALAALSRHARITPGRKAEERVLTLSPRMPTVRMTAEIVAALAARVTDATAVRAEAAAGRASPGELRVRPNARAA